MPIFSRHGKFILYVHVPKTGGTSIERFFINNGFSIHWVDGGGPGSLLPILSCSPQHLHASVITQLVRLDRFHHIFMTVRNPTDRIVSEYVMRRKSKHVDVEFGEWLRRSIDTYAANPYILDNHIRPQTEFWLPQSKVYRLEDGFGATWVEQVCRDIPVDFPHRTVDWLLRRGEIDPLPPISRDERRLIEQFYKTDFEAFGYGVLD